VKRGHRVTIFASSFHYYQHQETKLSAHEKWKIETVEGVSFVWIRTFRYERNDWRRVLNMLSYSIRAWRLGRMLPKLDRDVRGPSVIIGSSVHLLAVLAAYGVAKHYGAKFIMEVRDLWPQTIIDMGELSERHPLTTLLRALEKFLYRRADRIITVLPFAHEYLAACGVPQDKIVWIPNGVDLTRFPVAPASESSRNSFEVLYLGAHGQANALDVLLEAAQILQAKHAEQNIVFQLIGDGSEKPRLIQRAKELALRNVKFHEPIPKADTARALSQVDALLFHLERAQVFRYGISPNKLFDYMAAAKPILFCADAPQNPVEQAQCGLTVQPRNSQALAQAILTLCQMPQAERQAMGKRGREFVEKYHAIPLLAEKWIRCIEAS